MSKVTKLLLVIGTTITVAVIFTFVLTLSAISTENAKRIIALENGLMKIASSTGNKITTLEQQMSVLTQNLSNVNSEGQKIAASLKEIANRPPTVIQKSEQDLVTTAVAKVTPSVLSVIAVKDIPQYEVVYQNPFGDDPMFKNFNIQVPVMKQKGTALAQVGAGTGFFVTIDGFIVTNRHVVIDKNASYVAFLPDGSRKEVVVIYRDPDQDVAVLKISGNNYKPVSLGNSSVAKLGQTVIAVGNALGQYNNTVSVGIISGLNRTITASDSAGTTETLKGVIQIDAAINPGNSGGPLVDLGGNVIGVNVATITGSSNISFSIPINIIKATLQTALGRSF